MRILLTGANGFIGINLLRFLKQQSDVSIVTLGRTAPAFPVGTTHLPVTEMSAAQIESALQGCVFDVLIHLAAAGVHPADRDYATLVNINTFLPGYLTKLAKACGAKAVVIAGSNAEYQAVKHQVKITEITPLETGKLYGTTKASGGMLALAQGVVEEIPVAVLRIFNAYGPYEAPHRLLPSLITQLAANKRVPLSLGMQVRDFIYVEDVCKGFWAATNALLKGEMPSGAYNLATGIAATVADFARMVADTLKAPKALLDFGALSLRPDDLPYLVGEPNLLQQYCKWRATYSLQAGIKTAAAEYLLKIQ